MAFHDNWELRVKWDILGYPDLKDFWDNWDEWDERNRSVIRRMWGNPDLQPEPVKLHLWDIQDKRVREVKHLLSDKSDIQGVSHKLNIGDKPLYSLLLDLWDKLDRPPKPPIRVLPPNLHKQATDDKLDQWGYLDELRYWNR